MCSQDAERWHKWTTRTRGASPNIGLSWTRPTPNLSQVTIRGTDENGSPMDIGRTITRTMITRQGRLNLILLLLLRIWFWFWLWWSHLASSYILVKWFSVFDVLSRFPCYGYSVCVCIFHILYMSCVGNNNLNNQMTKYYLKRFVFEYVHFTGRTLLELNRVTMLTQKTLVCHLPTFI
jgi:hypothetical protein